MHVYSARVYSARVQCQSVQCTCTVPECTVHVYSARVYSTVHMYSARVYSARVQCICTVPECTVHVYSARVYSAHVQCQSVSRDHMNRNGIVHLDLWSIKIFSGFVGLLFALILSLGLLSYGVFVHWAFLCLTT